MTWADLERIEATAWADLYDAAPAHLTSAVGLTRATVDGAVVLRARMPAALFNRTCGVVAVTDAVLATAEPTTYLQIAPALLDDPVRARLAARGLVVRTRWVKLCRDLAPTPAVATTTVRVVEADAATAALFGRTLVEGYELPSSLAPWNSAIVGRPGWRAYLAFDGERPIGTAAMFLHDGRAWLGAAATVPDARGRGAQSALIARRITDAGTLGVTALVTETGVPAPGRRNPSLDNLLRLGFTAAYERENFTPS
jgi:GNAT superfamily N-acetyltransferase